MFTYHLAFLSPWYLLLLALIPVLWWYSFRKLAGLGSVRRMVVLIIRSLVLLGLILALAEIQIVRTSDRLTVIYLLDQSLSIPAQSREAMIDYVNAEIREASQGPGSRGRDRLRPRRGHRNSALRRQRADGRQDRKHRSIPSTPTWPRR